MEPEDFVGLWSNDCGGENAFREKIKRFLCMGAADFTDTLSIQNIKL